MAENKEVKRLNYFTSQFLQEDDFNDEQAYHIRMRRLHNRALHTWGVVEGLVVSLVPGSKSVAITPGTAIDNAGKEIVLPSDPAPQPIDLSAVTKGTDVFITIAYNEVDDPADKYTTAGVEGKYKRKTERPLLKPDASPLNDGSVIILAKVSVDVNSNVGNPDNTVRRLASAALAPATDLEVRSLKWANNSRLVVDQGGSIELGGDNDTAGTGTPFIDFHFSGKREDFNTRIINDADGRLSLQAPVVRATGSVGIGTPTPATQLHIRKDAGGALGPIITLMNGGGSPGAGASIDFDGYDTAANAPSLRIQSLDDGNFSSHLSISTKKAGAATNSLEERLRITSSGSVGIGTPTPGARLTVQQGGTSSVAAANGKGLFVSALMGTGAASDGGIEFRHDNLSQGIGFGYNTIYATGSNANQDLSIQSRGTGSVLLNPTSGNVGIGVASAPSAKLQVTGGAIMPAIGNNEQSGIQFPPDPGVGTGDRAFIRYYVESGTETTKLMIGVANDSDDAIGFTQFGAERMTIFNGNVGIGTPTPGARLTVQQGGTSSAVAANGKGLFVSALMGTGAASDGGIEFRHDNLSQGIGFGYNTIYATGSNANQDLSIQSRGTGSVLLNPTSGNVGIGAASAPIAKLQVTGGAIMPAIGNNEQSGIQFPPDPGVGTGDRAFIRYYVESGTETTKLMIGVANDRDDAIGFTQFGAERMTIYNGNVGIGSFAPQAKLEVAGSIRSTMWNVTQVFNERAGALPLGGTFTSAGGTLLIFASGSGFLNVGGGGIGMAILIDGAQKGTAIGYTNEQQSHKVFVANALVVTAIAAGQHTLGLAAAPGFATITDSNDKFSVTILELPW